MTLPESLSVVAELESEVVETVGRKTQEVTGVRDTNQCTGWENTGAFLWEEGLCAEISPP